MPLDLSPDSVDAYKPNRMAALAETAGVYKARLALGPLFALALLAGAFIGFGALFYMVTMTGTDSGYGPARLLGGIAFSLGLVLVIIAGAELFTGNNLMVMAWAHGHVSTVYRPSLYCAIGGSSMSAISPARSAWYCFLYGKESPAAAADGKDL